MRSPSIALLKITQLAALVLALLLGCGPAVSPGPALAPGEPAATATAAKAYPLTVAEAASLKGAGVSWSNEEIRVHYNRIVSAIGPADEGWKREGLSPEARARRAFEIRHKARLTCRAMMASAEEVSDLRKRDQEKYGNPDGPTFEQLVEGARKKGVAGDAVYEGIITSAQRTDEKTNAAYGIPKTP